MSKFFNLVFHGTDNRFKKLDLTLTQLPEDELPEELPTIHHTFTPPTSSLQNISIDFSNLPDLYTSYFGLLDYLPHLPCVTEVSVSFFHPWLEKSVPLLCQLIQQNTRRLRSLAATYKYSYLRRAPHYTARLVGALKPMVELLKEDHTLEHLSLCHQANSGDFSLEELETIRDVLKENVTLQSLVLKICLKTKDDLILKLKKLTRDDNPPPEARLASQIQYYLQLNQCGRKLIRDPASPLLDLVDSVQRAKETKVQYGLLRESVFKWAGSNIFGHGGEQS